MKKRGKYRNNDMKKCSRKAEVGICYVCGEYVYVDES